MKKILIAALLALPALRAGAEVPPELREQLKKEAAQLEVQAAAAPKDAELRVRLGLTYSRLEQADEAQRAFEAALTLDPKNAGAHFMLGLIFEKKGLRDRAIAEWKACLENAADPRMKEKAAKHLKQLSLP